MRKAQILILLLPIFFCSCEQTIEGRLQSYVSQKGDTIMPFSFTEITDFDWDAMYYFDNITPFEILETVTGRSYEGEPRVRRLIFKHGDEVVYEEKLRTLGYNIEGFSFYFLFKGSRRSILPNYQKAYGVDEKFMIIKNTSDSYCLMSLNNEFE